MRHRAFSVMSRAAIGLFLIARGSLTAGSKVQGTLSSDYGPIKGAIVTFISSNDTLRRNTTVTDATGYYSLDIVTGISPVGKPPAQFQLAPNYPNPFSTRTVIPYSLEQTSTPVVRIYDILGSLVKELAPGEQAAGSHGLTWDGTNLNGSKVAAGVYFYQLTSRGESQTRKLLFNGILGKSTLAQYMDPVHVSTQTSTCRPLSPATASFTVILQSSDSTMPPIVSQQISGVVLASDTTLNFTVEEPDDFAFCYTESAFGDNQIFLNNLKGTHPRDISNYTAGADGYPQWSPDGKYIVFQRLAPIFSPFVYVYDVVKHSYINLTADGGEAQTSPQWAPNGKVVFAYERPVLAVAATYMMNPDGSGIQKILDSVATNVFFYSDSYRFLYVMDWTRVYKTDIDGTTNQFICDLQQLMNQSEVAQGFNPSTEEILITYISPTDSMGRVAGLNITTKTVHDLCTADTGYVFYQVNYSNDCTEIAGVEHRTEDEWLSVVKNGIKTRYVQIPLSDPLVRFAWEKIRIACSDERVAYTVMAFRSGSATFLRHVFVLDQSTKTTRWIGFGWEPSWRPGY